VLDTVQILSQREFPAHGVDKRHFHAGQFDARREQVNALIMVQENISPMNLGIIQVVGAHKLRSIIVVLDAGDCLLVYAVSMVNAVFLPVLDRLVRNSFSTRAEAVIKWFAGRADMALGR
jgi:hypothetical protein